MKLLYTAKEVVNTINTIDDVLTILFNQEYGATIVSTTINNPYWSNYYDVTNIIENKQEELLESFLFFIVRNQPELDDLYYACTNLLYEGIRHNHRVIQLLACGCLCLTHTQNIPKIISKFIYYYRGYDNDVISISVLKFNNKFHVVDYKYSYIK